LIFSGRCLFLWYYVSMPIEGSNPPLHSQLPTPSSKSVIILQTPNLIISIEVKIVVKLKLVRLCLQIASGLRITNATFNAVVMRYSDQDGKVFFDDFLACVSKLKTLFGTFIITNSNWILLFINWILPFELFSILFLKFKMQLRSLGIVSWCFEHRFRMCIRMVSKEKWYYLVLKVTSVFNAYD